MRTALNCKGKVRRTNKEIRDDAYAQLAVGFRVRKKTGCWLWQGLRVGKKHYGRLRRVPRKVPGVHGRAHICSYLRAHNLPRVPKGMYVCHHCDTPHCINPEHLWLGSNQENQIDAVNKGVFARYWTKARRIAWGRRVSGVGNPMHGRTGRSAPAFGRIGAKHPMFGKHHSSLSKKRISRSLRKAHREGRR